jgi:PncC family amidohydrolase
VTSVPGSSAVFVAGVVAYADAAKEALLGVRRATLARHGAVSRQVVAEMLAGARAATGAACALALSGIAGPAGGTPRKPVGLVWIGAAAPGRIALRRCRFGGLGRRSVKELSSWCAMKLLLDEVEAKESG